MHLVQDTPAVCTISTNRFGGYAPVLHRKGTQAPARPTTGLAFPTVDQALDYARAEYGTPFVAITDHRSPGEPLTAA